MATVISLEGNWSCRLDPEFQGVRECWQNGTVAEHRVTLPGSTQTNRIGPAYSTQLISNLTPNTEHIGPAWYWRDVELSERDCGQYLELVLERVCWESRVWLNGTPLGTCDSLVGSHVYNLTQASRPGTNRLTIMVDNSNLKNEGAGTADSLVEDEELAVEKKAESRLHCGGHHASFGGLPWNGITGAIELRVMPNVRLGSIQVYPDVARKLAVVACSIANTSCKEISASFTLTVDSQTVQSSMVLPSGSTVTRTEIDLSAGLKLWDEHCPELYELTATLESECGVDERQATFGMRQLSRVDNRFAINGRPAFLRGALEKFVHPLTGYPPTDVEYWLTIFQVHKDHGLNHLRFHSCCPPKAAFMAADRLGIILNVELPGASGGESTDNLTQNYLQDEALRILDEFGNHPSFCMLTMGNEILCNEVSQADGMARLMARVARCREHDPRHWYCCTAHAYTPGRDDDFYVTAWPNGPTAKDRHNGEPLRGFRWNGGDVVDDSRFNTRPPETASDYRDGIAGIPSPVITHEVGMWAVYPDISEIPTFTGVLKPFNLEIIRDFMHENGTLSMARRFVEASGKLSALLYKEEIEAALRTPGLSGTQLLGIHDHPPQGTSTIGIVTALRKEKGIISPEEFRHFCSETVPLARLKKRTFTADETFTVDVEVAHYGKTDLKQAAVRWRLTTSSPTPPDATGAVIEGRFDARRIPTGDLSSLGSVTAELKRFPTPSKFTLEVFLDGTTIYNSWDCWVFPPTVSSDAHDVLWAHEWTANLAKVVEDGATAIVELGKDQIPHATRGCFTTLLWNPIMKRKHHSQTMGILCDPSHPALSAFPTEFHTNWQWWDIIHPSLVLDISGLSPRPEPIIRMVDSFIGNRHLCPVFEARLGNGRVIITSLELRSDLDSRLAARQFRHSLLQYAASDTFSPAVAITSADITTLISAHREPRPVPSREEVNARFDRLSPK